MVGDLQPLERQFPIVDQDGRPTVYFIRWAQQRMQDIQGAVTPEQALEIATTFVLEFLAANPLAAGVGIDLTPSGNIADGVTISANAQAILDVISSTQGAILYRGATQWEALAPGTAGQFLQTAGAGADPLWAAAGGGGGGGAWALAATWTYSTPVANVPFTGLSAYSELLIIFRLVTLSVSGQPAIQVSTNNGSSYFTTSGDYVAIDNNGVEAGAGVVSFTDANATAARSAVGRLSGINVNGGPKLIERITRANTGTLFVGSTSPIDAIRALPSAGGNFTGGNIFLFAR